MAKEKGKEEKKKEQTIFNLAINALVGKESETTEEAAKTFLDFWQRKQGESIVSAQNIVKAATVIGGYAVYRHVDPVPNSKIDNLGVFGAAAVLLVLLAVPRSSELGGRFSQFEGVVLQRIKDDCTPEQKKEILRFIRELSNWQEKRVLNLLKIVGEDGKTSFDPSILKEEEMRKTLLEFIGDEPSMKEDVEKAVVAAKKFFTDNWPATKEKLVTADETIAGGLRTFRGWLNSKGVRR
ncbi:MAG TPA: hypothetical protein VJK01_02285 [Candidatus Paceibacterota bacterium]